MASIVLDTSVASFLFLNRPERLPYLVHNSVAGDCPAFRRQRNATHSADTWAAHEASKSPVLSGCFVVFWYHLSMLVKAVRVKLRTNDITDAALADTMARFNAACNALARQAWETQTFRAFTLHNDAYHKTRADFGLPAPNATPSGPKEPSSSMHDASRWSASPRRN